MDYRVDYRAISIRIDGDGVRISIPGAAPDKFYDILGKQGFKPLPENSQQWRAPLSAKNWVMTRLYPKLREHGALVFEFEPEQPSPPPSQSKAADDTVIQSLVEEVERLKKLSNELNERLSALKKKR